jgi:hypothetical protein
MLGNCVDTSVIATVAPIVALIFVAIGAVDFIRYKNFKNDQLWMVPADELQFDDPVEVIGQGSFGVVLKAEWPARVW